MGQQRLPVTSTMTIADDPSISTEKDIRREERDMAMIVVEVEADPPLYRFAKRVTDIVVSVLLMALLSWLFLLIYLLVKLTSKGPAIYRQTRVGLGGRPFTFYKFRSMVDGAEAMLDEVMPLNTTGGPTFKNERDPRVTPVGRVLRRTSLDELPQLYNVLRGEMSLVGPRPPLPSEVEKYTDGAYLRLSVKPGITCLWQVQGRSKLCFAKQVQLDLEYIRRRGYWLDLCILLRTIPAVLTCRGAC